MKCMLKTALIGGVTLLLIVMLWPCVVQPPSSVRADSGGIRTFSFVNDTSETIWAGSSGNPGFPAPAGGGWEMAPGSTFSVTVSNNWQGRFWGRTYCSFNGTGTGRCETGDCGGVLKCNGAGGATPASLAEFTLDGADGQDTYDVSYVDGFNVPMTISPIGGASPRAGDHYWCGVAGCGTDLNVGCPSPLRIIDSSGRTVACNSACNAFNTDQYCCRGNYNATNCKPTTWPVNYAAYFKSGCPDAYSYAYDDLTSTFSDSGANYLISFGPPPGGGKTVVSTGGGGVTGAPPAIVMPQEHMAFAENNPNSATTKITSGPFHVQVTSAGSGALHFTFTPDGWSPGAVTIRYDALGGAMHESQMSNEDGSWQYTANNLGQKGPVAYWFSFQQDGVQYTTDSCAVWTSS
ncbi:thaumatin family protein [Dictyobacter aurantiacus]|uniref:CBM56 domain-containing protein n=1 Tax=Dictyobacter aurantiacus TaxID=1936993 RepID=A0A401Z9H6_9CHLR|nr:thaumatin family protein [Dictyobacter aurantiacus]GCE03463.1 hypothetical protein KDAU_07920 [Dictyobacter aurantiacus]